MATMSTPRSILKNGTGREEPTSTKAARDLELALYHANLIQARKDIELEILFSMEELIEFPLTPSRSASSPAPADAAAVKKLLRLYQPSDYDALIVERNINDKCGYVLCPNRNKKDGKGGKYRIVGKYGKASDFKVVERQETEKWCGEECARRALYIRVQMSERPAWERGALGEAELELMDEPREETEEVVEQLERMDLSGGGNDLALERGDRGFMSRKGLLEENIKENETQGKVQPPSFGPGELSDRLDTLHLSLEGHNPLFGRPKGADDDDEIDTDWKM